jgi:hypothetical protein
VSVLLFCGWSGSYLGNWIVGQIDSRLGPASIAVVCFSNERIDLFAH